MCSTARTFDWSASRRARRLSARATAMKRGSTTSGSKPASTSAESASSSGSTAEATTSCSSLPSPCALGAPVGTASATSDSRAMPLRSAASHATASAASGPVIAGRRATCMRASPVGRPTTTSRPTNRDFRSVSAAATHWRTRSLPGATATRAQRRGASPPKRICIARGSSPPRSSPIGPVLRFHGMRQIDIEAS